MVGYYVTHSFVCRFHHCEIVNTLPYHRPSPATAMLLLSQPSISFDAPVNGWLLRSPPTKQFQFPHSWTYFDLLRVSTHLVYV